MCKCVAFSKAGGCRFESHPGKPINVFIIGAQESTEYTVLHVKNETDSWGDVILISPHLSVFENDGVLFVA